MPEPRDMVLPLLREIRPAKASWFDQVDHKLDEHDARFDKLERRFENLRRAVDGETVLGRYADAEVDDRPDAIETRRSVLDTRCAPATRPRACARSSSDDASAAPAGE